MNAVSLPWDGFLGLVVTKHIGGLALGFKRGLVGLGVSSCGVGVDVATRLLSCFFRGLLMGWVFLNGGTLYEN